MRLWVRYEASGLCQWLRRGRVRRRRRRRWRAPTGRRHLSRRAGRAGVELWLLLDGAQAGGSAFTVRFGEAAAAAALLAPNVINATTSLRPPFTMRLLFGDYAIAIWRLCLGSFTSCGVPATKR